MTNEQLQRIRKEAHNLTPKQAEMAFYNILGRLINFTPQPIADAIEDVKRAYPRQETAA